MLAIGKYTNSYLHHMEQKEKHYIWRATPWDEDCDTTCFEICKTYHSLQEALQDVLEIMTELKSDSSGTRANDMFEFGIALCDGICFMQKEY